MMSNPLLCRYQVSANYWHLNMYNMQVGKPPRDFVSQARTQGQPGDEPDWLKTILAVATVGDHFILPADPPPYKVLWFHIDEHNNLLRFGYD